jgi:hypothetical protein
MTLTTNAAAIGKEGSDMTKRSRRWIVLMILIGAVLGGAYVIVARSNPALSASADAAPSGVFH